MAFYSNGIFAFLFRQVFVVVAIVTRDEGEIGLQFVPYHVESCFGSLDAWFVPQMHVADPCHFKKRPACFFGP